jgi:hypothetical protein
MNEFPFEVTGRVRSRAEAMAAIEAERAGGHPPPNASPKRLPLSAIQEEPLVFQLRQDGPTGSLLRSEAHIRALGRAMSTAKGQLPGDRIAVWWSGSRWIVVDGHHRLEAYRRWAQSGAKRYEAVKLDVEVVAGNLNAALKRTASENSKARLQMTKAERLGRAWLLVIREAEGSVRHLAGITGASKSTVGNMYPVRDTLRARGMTDQGMIEKGWEDCYRAYRGQAEVPEGEEPGDATVAAWSGRIREHFGAFAGKHPEMFAKALAHYSREMVVEMIRSGAWDEELEEATDREALEGDEDGDD